QSEGQGQIEEDGGRPAGPQHADAGHRPRDDVVSAIRERSLSIASRPTKLQERAFGLLGIDPSKTVVMRLAGREGGIRAIPPAGAGVFFISFA
ncbi:MAG: hypothetical protein OXN84_21885, partial [Albidovulum sp.]|nr:hypothetical protein [Albidovulum sp.]